MIAGLFNIPTAGQDEFYRWSFDNQDAHGKIISAIFQQKNVLLDSYILDPMPMPNDPNFGVWAYNHQSAHSAYEGILNIQGSDYTDVDWTKEDQVESWIRIHAFSHQQAQQILGYPD